MSRAGDGNRTRVLSLGSPSTGFPRPADSRKIPAQTLSHGTSGVRWCTLFVVACCTQWVRSGLLHAVARTSGRFSAMQAENIGGLARIELATSALSGRSEDSLHVPMRAGTCRFRWSPDSSGLERGTSREPVGRTETHCWDEVGTENAILADRSIEIAPSTARSPAIPTDGGGTEGSHKSYAGRIRHFGLPNGPAQGVGPLRRAGATDNIAYDIGTSPRGTCATTQAVCPDAWRCA